MFHNIGKKIQAVVSVVFFLQIMASFTTGYELGKFCYELTGETGLAVFIGLTVILIGCFIAWLSQLIIFAYGKIAECCEEQVRITRQILVKLDSDSEKEIKICSVCGKELDNDSLFCPECGTKAV